MLALTVEVLTMQPIREISSFYMDSKYSSDHGPLLHFPHFSACHVYKQTIKADAIVKN